MKLRNRQPPVEHAPVEDLAQRQEDQLEWLSFLFDRRIRAYCELTPAEVELVATRAYWGSVPVNDDVREWDKRFDA